MPTPLHKEMTWHRMEIDFCKKVMAEMEGCAPSPEKDAALARIRATLQVHEETLAELEAKLA